MTLMSEFKKLTHEDATKRADFYNNILNLNHNIKHQISNEMINHQLDDPFVKQCSKCFEEIIDILNTTFKGKKANTSSYLKNVNIRACVDKIDMLIYDRFGLPAKHITDNMTPYACFPVSPNMNTVLDIDSDWEALQAYAKNKTIKGNLKDETTLTENSFFRIAKSAREFEKQLNAKGIKIDLNKAYISGLPKDFTCYILVDFNFLIKKCKMSSLELVAILVHELGHLFTHIEYSYKLLAKTNVIIETVYENIAKKGKSVKDTLLLIAPNVLPDEQVKKLASKDTPTIVVNVVKGLTSLTTQPYWYTDSEQLADQFAGRFGLSEELVTALSKFPAVNNEFKQEMLYFNIIPMNICTLVFLLICISASVTGVFMLFAIMGSVMAVMNTFFWFRLGKEMETDVSKGRTYDDLKQRYTRIKLELIRRLRNCEFTKPELIIIINKIETVDKFINSAPDVELGWVEQLKRFFFSTTRDLAESKELEQLIEKLMENNLYLASAKLKTLTM